MDDYLWKRIEKLKDVEDYDEECDTCRKPRILHVGVCIRSEKVMIESLIEIWKLFMDRIGRILKAKVMLLKKPMYGLDDDSRKFWRKIREVFLKLEDKKIAACKIKPYELVERGDGDDKEVIDGKEANHVNFDDDEEGVVDDGDDLRKDIVGAHYMKIERREHFGEASVFVVELPISEHGRPEVLEAKETEMENLRAYETFEEVEDEGQKTIGS